MKRLRPSQHGSQSLEGNSYHVVVGLLSGERTAGRLSMKPQHVRLVPFSFKSFPHDFPPEPSGCPEFGNLFDEGVMAAEEEGEPGGKGIHIKTCPDRRLHISYAIGQSKGHFLDSRATCLTHVITAEADGIPSGDTVFTKCKNIGDDAHRFEGWIDVS